MFEWFGKKTAQPETSAGGSVIHRYPAKQWSPGQTGFTDESTAKFAEARSEVYQRFFGEAHSVSHEALPLIPHIDVYTYYRRGPGGDVCTLVTSGMSDLEMRVPSRTTAPGRTELILY